MLFCRHYFSLLNTLMSKGKDPDPHLWLKNGSGSGRPKPMRIRIPNTHYAICILSSRIGKNCILNVKIVWGRCGWQTCTKKILNINAFLKRESYVLHNFSIICRSMLNWLMVLKPFTFLNLDTNTVFTMVSDPDSDGSALIWVAGSGSAFKLRIRIQEGKNDPQNKKKIQNFCVSNYWMFSFEGWRLLV
jgi:hypothetical protein